MFPIQLAKFKNIKVGLSYILTLPIWLYIGFKFLTFFFELGKVLGVNLANILSIGMCG